MPVELQVLFSFIGAALVLVLSPGPDTMLILRYTIGSGQRVGLATVAGVQAGLAVHSLAAVVGLSVLIAANPIALQAVAILGSLYLACLGLQSIMAAAVTLDGTAVQVGAAKACRDAFLTNLLNPKVLLLFLALMPQFIRPGGSPVAVQLAFLGLALIVVNTAWQAFLAISADRIRRWLNKPSVQRAVSLSTGIVLIVFSILMAREYLV